ncbi:cytochrome c [Anopheles sinensis]|uniref:Cytochrome c n=1 Tax=Anopheles sinensis TaxID=74873 RepID=A0A084VEM4_ANOSI|nr:cytochrome c [Anopheles sinensis]
MSFYLLPPPLHPRAESTADERKPAMATGAKQKCNRAGPATEQNTANLKLPVRGNRSIAVRPRPSGIDRSDVILARLTRSRSVRTMDRFQLGVRRVARCRNGGAVRGRGH